MSGTRALPYSERQLGLHQVYPDEGDSSIVTNLDIIAIHGLDTQSPKTWVMYKDPRNPAAGEVHWLRDPDMLPAKIPGARILTYDWNANFDENAAQAGLLTHADHFLDQINIERSEANRTGPIVFVASCFGGLLLAKALHRAAETDNNYHHIYRSTVGIAFLGTPFYGSDQGFHTAAQICLAVAISEGRETSGELVAYLNNSSGKTAQLNEVVHLFTETVVKRAQRGEHSPQIKCFYETHRTDFRGVLARIPEASLSEAHQQHLGEHRMGVLVPESSACLPGYFKMGLYVRHNMLNKFSGPRDKVFITVAHHLKELAFAAQTDQDYLLAGRTKYDEYRSKPRGKGDVSVLEQAIEQLQLGAKHNSGSTLLSDVAFEINVLLSASFLELACMRTTWEAEFRVYIGMAGDCLTTAERTHDTYSRLRVTVERAKWRAFKSNSKPLGARKGVKRAIADLESAKVEAEKLVEREQKSGRVDTASKYETELRSIQELVSQYKRL